MWKWVDTTVHTQRLPDGTQVPNLLDSDSSEDEVMPQANQTVNFNQQTVNVQHIAVNVPVPQDNQPRDSSTELSDLVRVGSAASTNHYDMTDGVATPRSVEYGPDVIDLTTSHFPSWGHTYRDHMDWAHMARGTIVNNTGDGDWNPHHPMPGDGSTAYHSQVQLIGDDQGPVIDPGSIYNLCGGNWSRMMAKSAAKHGRTPD